MPGSTGQVWQLCSPTSRRRSRRNWTGSSPSPCPHRPHEDLAAALNQPADVAVRPGPRKLGDVAACGSSVQVTLLKVDATISPGEAGLVRRVAEGCPAKRQVAGRHGAGLKLRAPGWKRDRPPEPVAPSEESQDLCPGRA